MTQNSELSVFFPLVGDLQTANVGSFIERKGLKSGGKDQPLKTGGVGERGGGGRSMNSSYVLKE